MMGSTIVSLALALAAGSGGWQGPYPACHCQYHGTRVLPPGPGYGWGFPNNNPDGYGWHDIGDRLPLGPDRHPEYYFPRYFATPPEQMFLQNYYNPYVTRGQRYISHAGCGGCHPMGGSPPASAATPTNPYRESVGTGPRVPVPTFSGRVEAPPVPTGASGLTP
jgi:hypothetical protein